MATAISTIKNWFLTGLKPTQVQFWAVFDSFRHKNDNIPISEVQGLSTALEKKATTEEFESHISDTNAHPDLFNSKADLVDGKVPLEQLPDYEHTHGIDEIAGLADELSGKEELSNKQSDLSEDSSGDKYPNITAIRNAKFIALATGSPVEIQNFWFGTRAQYEALSSAPTTVNYVILDNPNKNRNTNHVKNITIVANSSTVQDNDLIGATLINFIVKNGVTTQGPFTFNPVTGTITYTVVISDILSISYSI